MRRIDVKVYTSHARPRWQHSKADLIFMLRRCRTDEILGRGNPSADVDWHSASRAITWLVVNKKREYCRSDGESVSSGRPLKGILRSAGSARSSELTSHMISPRMSADAELPGGMPIGEGHSLAASGNTSGKLGSSQLARSAA